MYCSKCGEIIDNESKFCRHCGFKIVYANPVIYNQTVDKANSIPEHKKPPTNEIRDSNKKGKRNEFDLSYKKETIATVIGIIIVVLNIIILIIATSNHDIFRNSSDSTNGLPQAISIILRIFCTVYVVNIAKRQNRNKSSWGFFTFFFPSIALIIIGTLRKKNKFYHSNNTLKSDNEIDVDKKITTINSENKIYDAPINKKCGPNGLFGFVDRFDNLIIPFQFDGASEFSEELALVFNKSKSTDKYGFIDKNGEFIIEPKFEYVESFSNGFALVRLNNKFGYIDKSGKYLMEPQFQSADSFKDNKAKVIFNKKQYFINTKGEKVD